VQVVRYTGRAAVSVRAANGELELEEVFYLRAVAQLQRPPCGKKVAYTRSQRQSTWPFLGRRPSVTRPAWPPGFARKHARASSPFDYRQPFVVSFSPCGRCCTFRLARQARLAQLNSPALRNLIWPHLETWAPEFCRLVREKPPAQRPASPLDLGWLSKQWPGVQGVHIRARSPARAGLGYLPWRSL